MDGRGDKVAMIGAGSIKLREKFHQSLTDMVYATASA